MLFCCCCCSKELFCCPNNSSITQWFDNYLYYSFMYAFLVSLNRYQLNAHCARHCARCWKESDGHSTVPAIQWRIQWGGRDNNEQETSNYNLQSATKETNTCRERMMGWRCRAASSYRLLGSPTKFKLQRTEWDWASLTTSQVTSTPRGRGSVCKGSQGKRTWLFGEGETSRCSRVLIAWRDVLWEEVSEMSGARYLR